MPIVIQNKKRQAFNSVFGLSRKKYKELVEKDKKANGEITE